MNEATAKAIVAERAISGITVRELSERTGIPMSSLMRVLQAEREIKVNQVAKIAAAFELYPHEIMEHAERLLERSGPRSSVPLPPQPTDATVHELRPVEEAEPDPANFTVAARRRKSPKKPDEPHAE